MPIYDQENHSSLRCKVDTELAFYWGNIEVEDMHAVKRKEILRLFQYNKCYTFLFTIQFSPLTLGIAIVYILKIISLYFY